MTGLASVTFRMLTVEDIVKAVKKSGLTGIEWGADVHVPPGDQEAAQMTGKLTKRAGLKALSYGSYYRLGMENDFAPVLRAAMTLNAPVIRVWAGEKGSSGSDADYYEKVAKDAVRICKAARQYQIQISTEYHANTLTDTPESTLRLMKLCHGNLKTYWQLDPGLDFEQNFYGLKMIQEHLSSIHVFYLDKNSNRLGLEEGLCYWKIIIDFLGGRFPYILEFVKGNSVDQFYSDAKSLISLTRNALY